MSYGKIFSKSLAIASAAATSAVCELAGKSWTYMAIYHTAGGAVDVYGSNDGTTFAPVQERLSTSTAQFAAVRVTSALSGSWVTINPLPFNYIQFVATGTVANGTTVQFSAAD